MSHTGNLKEAQSRESAGRDNYLEPAVLQHLLDGTDLAAFGVRSLENHAEGAIATDPLWLVGLDYDVACTGRIGRA